MLNKSSKAQILFAIAAFVLMIMLLIPLFVIGKYDAPIADDFSYAKNTHEVWEQTHDFGAVLSESAKEARSVYDSWQGTYSAIILMSLQPGIFGMDTYRVSVYILIGSLLIGLLFFIRALVKSLNLHHADGLLIFSLCGILFTQFLPSPVQGFYWYNGSVFYTFYFGLSLLFFGLLVSFSCRRKGHWSNIFYYIFLPVLAVILGGGNYSTCLLVAILLPVYIIWRLVKKERNLLPLIVLVVFLACFAFSLKAPGNAARQSENSGIYYVLRSGIKAVLKTAASIAHWTNLPVILGTLVVIPVAVRFSKRSGFSFPCPVLLSIVSFFLIASGFMPTLYTQDFTGSARLLDIQYYLYILLLIINVFYITGWICRHISISNRGINTKLLTVVYLATLLIACIGSYDMFSSYKAVVSVASGEASGYWEESVALWDQYLDPKVKDVYVDEFENCPELLVERQDLNSNPDSWQNQLAAYYFDKDSVQIGGK